MNSKFNWQLILDNVYDRFPEASRRPVIGITSNYVDGEERLSRYYYKSVEKAGGVPLVIPPSADTDTIINTHSTTSTHCCSAAEATSTHFIAAKSHQQDCTP